MVRDERIKSECRATAEIVNRNLVRLHQLIAWEDLWFFTISEQAPFSATSGLMLGLSAATTNGRGGGPLG